MTLDPQDLSQTFVAPDQGAPQTFPSFNLESWDRKARLAIEGMGPSPIADKLELYEKHYDQWIETFEESSAYDPAREMANSANTDFVGKMLCTVFPKTVSDIITRIHLMTREFYKTPLRIFRQEVEELALAHAKALSDLKAATVRDSFHAQYTKMVEENRQLRSFLMNNFPSYVETADALKIPLVEISKRIMLDQRKSDGAAQRPAESLNPGTDDAARLTNLSDALNREEPNAGR